MTKKLLFITALFLFAVTTQAQITINGQSTPTSIKQDTQVSVSITYTSSVTIAEWQIQLFPINPDGSINYGGTSTQIYVGNYYTGSNPPITGNTLPIATTPTTLNFTSYCDGSIVPVGNYKWFVKLKESSSTPEADVVYGDNNIAVTVGTLSSPDFKKLSSVFLVNSATKTLHVLDNFDNVKNASIYNMAGQMIKTIPNISSNVTYDLSKLTKGLYILITSDNQKLKFSI